MFHLICRGLVVALFSLATIAAATSAPVSLGELQFGEPEFFGNNLDAGTGMFTDEYTFSLESDRAVEVDIVQNNLGTFGDVKITDLSGNVIGQGVSGTQFTVGGLNAETDYTLAISGDVTGDDGGSYNAAIVAAVPLPAAAWLFGSALLGVVVVARRRDATPHGPSPVVV